MEKIAHQIVLILQKLLLAKLIETKPIFTLNSFIFFKLILLIVKKPFNAVFLFLKCCLNRVYISSYSIWLNLVKFALLNHVNHLSINSQIISTKQA
jgi:hypothetical protein